jgi:superfamily II DNA or RNA helicase
MLIPRLYQTEAIEKVIEALRIYDRVAAVLPTGSGKSLVECRVIDKLLGTLQFAEGIVVLSHLTDVVDQLMDFFSAHSRYKNNAFRLKGIEKPRIQSKVFFTTIQTLVGQRAQQFFSAGLTRKTVKYVLIDEAHLFGTESYDTMIAMFPEAKIIGFSATPFRSNQYSFGLFDHVAYAIDTQSLIDQGFLAEPKLKVLNVGDMAAPERLASVIRIFINQERPRGLVSVVYTRTKMEAQELRLAAEEAGIKCEFVSGDSPEKFCRDLYRRARAGEVELIANCRKLETGVDIPNIGSIFMPWPVGSVVSYLQRTGRALRLYPGKDHANIYVFGDAPGIKDGKWAKLQRRALLARDPLNPVDNLKDTLEDLEEDGGPEERIAWTRTAIEACEHLVSQNLRSIAELISEKRFPQKYNRAIKRIAETMVPRVGKVTLASEAQISSLTRFHGFRREDAIRLSECECATLLASLEGFLNRDRFVLKHGPHAGKHMSETPMLYRRYIKDSANRALWLRWVKEGRPNETEPESTSYPARVDVSRKLPG